MELRTSKDDMEAALYDAEQNLQHGMGGGYKDGIVLDLRDTLAEVSALRARVREMANPEILAHLERLMTLASGFSVPPSVVERWYAEAGALRDNIKAIPSPLNPEMEGK